MDMSFERDFPGSETIVLDKNYRLVAHARVCKRVRACGTRRSGPEPAFCTRITSLGDVCLHTHASGRRTYWWDTYGYQLRSGTQRHMPAGVLMCSDADMPAPTTPTIPTDSGNVWWRRHRLC